MPDYQVYGGVFRSDVSFPELEAHSLGAPDWTLRVVRACPPDADLLPIGEEMVQEGVYARLHRTPRGFRLIYDDTGTFDIGPDGRDIVWYASATADLEAARLDIIGFVFATCFHAAGTLCLHGSAVAVEGRGIAFVAPKFHGKSTLARALTRAGARLATDDAVPIRLGSPPMMMPGLHQVRLWADSAARLEEEGIRTQMGYAGKQVVRDFPPERLMLHPVRLDAIYVLVPVQPGREGPVIRRTQLSGMQGAMALVVHTKAGHLFGGTEAPIVLDRASTAAAAVPVYALQVARDLNHLDTVARQLMEWHHPEERVSLAKPVPV